ncbi:MAG: class I SAM-dependent methyltransferase, partial [Alphaproteobacteria bacterium]|nr:class I SAM-dependent methyltransferase [Alphaproteobacteria bacterium]
APRRILDVGCGTGAQLTIPLAEAFPDIEITATDEDARSLAWARAHGRAPNLRFVAPDRLSEEQTFDLIIASEVLEHVADPCGFLFALGRRLGPGARLLLTVPNGFGVFEWMALAEIALNLTGLQGLARRLKKRRPENRSQPATLANSPHVNFFTFGELGALFAALGFAIERYQPRTLLCGYLVDSVLSGARSIALNAALADRLPAWCASDWMFELRPVCRPAVPQWRRGAWARLRKRLNEFRWRTATR